MSLSSRYAAPGLEVTSSALQVTHAVVVRIPHPYPVRRGINAVGARHAAAERISVGPIVVGAVAQYCFDSAVAPDNTDRVAFGVG